TFSPEIRRLSQSYLQDPVTVEVARPNATATNVEQRFYSVTDDDKRQVVRQLLKSRELSQAIIFVNSKLGAARLARSFERDGLRTAALHGDKSQDERLKSLAAFKAGEVDLLVATDVAARGLDIADLPAVFNFDVPYNAEDYVHRIGRTGRAGASGLAVTLVSRDDVRLVADIEKLIKKKLEIEPIEIEDDRPQRQQRPRRSAEDEAYRAPEQAQQAAGRVIERAAERPERTERPVVRRPSADPFFDKPYEPTDSGGAAWEAGKASAAAAKAASPNIRVKKKVASLLGGSH
ncbi:MAG: DEAD/DEAH box helicase, partial [Rubrivivax sp.]|nr:DEAD/DEAH box helicase [Rubrivivax sp.]